MKAVSVDQQKSEIYCCEASVHLSVCLSAHDGSTVTVVIYFVFSNGLQPHTVYSVNNSRKSPFHWTAITLPFDTT